MADKKPNLDKEKLEKLKSQKLKSVTHGKLVKK